MYGRQDGKKCGDCAICSRPRGDYNSIWSKQSFGANSDVCHICHNKEIAKYDKQQYESLQSQDCTDKFWSLFEGQRRYRPSGSSMRFYCDLEHILKTFMNTTEVELDVITGMLVTELQSKFNEIKSKLNDQHVIREFEHFFNNHQYGDTIDCEGYRNTGAWIIGYASAENEPIGLRFLDVWSEYGRGLPLEFGDAPKNYFESIRYQLIDPIRHCFDEIKSKDDEKYYYKDMKTEIEKRRKNPDFNSEDRFNAWSDGIVDLSKFPYNYVICFEAGDFLDWIPRKLFTEMKKMVDEDPDNYWTQLWQDQGYFGEALDGMYQAALNWPITYDRKVQERKDKIRNYICQIQSVLSDDLLRIIVDLIA